MRVELFHTGRTVERHEGMYLLAERESGELHHSLDQPIPKLRQRCGEEEVVWEGVDMGRWSLL